MLQKLVRFEPVNRIAAYQRPYYTRPPISISSYAAIRESEPLPPDPTTPKVDGESTMAKHCIVSSRIPMIVDEKVVKVSL